MKHLIYFIEVVSTFLDLYVKLPKCNYTTSKFKRLGKLPYLNNDSTSYKFIFIANKLDDQLGQGENFSEIGCLF